MQKIIQVGSSAAATISRRMLEELGLDVGDKISLSANKERRSITIEPASVVSEEFVSWTKAFTNKYHKALVALAKR